MNKIEHTIHLHDCSQLNDDELIGAFDAFTGKLKDLLSEGAYLSRLNQIGVLSIQIHVIIEEMNKREPGFMVLVNNYMEIDSILLNLNINNYGQN